ncbi:MAG: 7TM diverse intracellular signaling domain-containing protein [Sulfurimonas sp.]|jgi:two-component sensor histidine kinase|uniref:7TM diverse intracellular signaling domain-containing protein n=1 Tax=Sulfurimonas sp. TaxID=2022749 RepID=UPI0035671A49
MAKIKTIMLKILFFVFFSTVPLFSQTIFLADNQAPINLLQSGELYIDHGGVESFETLYNSSKFLKTSEEFINLGYAFKSVAWLRFTINNDSNETQKRYITVDNTMLDTIELYKPSEDGNYTKELSGVFQRERFDNILHFNFPVELKPSESQSYYLKVTSTTSALFFKSYLYNERDFYKEEISRQLFYTLFIGAMGILILYNFSLFLFSRDKTYLYYVFYMIASLAQHQTYTSMGLYMYPNDMIQYVIQYESHFGIYYMTILSLAMVLFTRSFLETYRYKKIDLFLKFMIVLNIALSLLNTDENSLLDIGMYEEYFLLIALLFIGFYLYYKKNAQAKYYIIGWGVMLSGVIGILLHNLGIFSVQYHSFYYIFEVTILFEATFFSIVLASRLKTLSVKLLQKEREYSSELESTVKERTKELHVALETENILKKELHHRVKNNMQFIISLFKLRLYPFMSDDINRVIKEVTYKIKGMARAHDMLYSQKSLNTIDTNEYFTQLINELKNGYETEHIRFDIKVETELDSDRLIYCGLIVNEVIINALKYAFDDGQNGVINLNLYKNKDETILELSDNGVGLKENHKQSFGLLMVNTLVTEQLKGTIEFDTKNGTTIKIKI